MTIKVGDEVLVVASVFFSFPVGSKGVVKEVNGDLYEVEDCEYPNSGNTWPMIAEELEEVL